MNLLERLKPQYFEKLEIIKNQYPVSYEKIIKSLEQNESVFALTFDDASSICMFFNIETTLNNTLNLFNE